MKRSLLVSDANVLIDLENGKLAKDIFRLSFRFLVPDILFEEELRQRHSHLLDFGLEKKSLQSEYVLKAFEFNEKYSKPSRNDLFALCLAIQEQAILLTGDKRLCDAAEQERVQYHGTIWLVMQMIEADILNLLDAKKAFEEMLDSGSRLPEQKIEEEMQKLKARRGD